MQTQIEAYAKKNRFAGSFLIETSGFLMLQAVYSVEGHGVFHCLLGWFIRYSGNPILIFCHGGIAPLIGGAKHGVDTIHHAGIYSGRDGTERTGGFVPSHRSPYLIGAVFVGAKSVFPIFALGDGRFSAKCFNKGGVY